MLPYPGTSTLETSDKFIRLDDVILTVTIWIEAEQITLDAAEKIEYTSENNQALQRVEFASRRRTARDWRTSQIAKQSEDIKDLRTGGETPHRGLA